MFSLSERKTSIFAVFIISTRLYFAIFCHENVELKRTHVFTPEKKRYIQKIIRFGAFYFQISRTSCHIKNINNGVSFSFILSIIMIQWTKYRCQRQNVWKFSFERKKKKIKFHRMTAWYFPNRLINASLNANSLLSFENMLHCLQKTMHNKMIQCNVCVCKTIIYKFPVDWTQPDLICTQPVLFGGCMSIYCAFVCIHFTRCELEKAIKSSLFFLFHFLSLSLLFCLKSLKRTDHWYSGYRTVGYRLPFAFWLA